MSAKSPITAGRRCHNHLSSDPTRRLFSQWHRAQDTNDFYLTTTKTDLKELVQVLHCTEHRDNYHDVHLLCYRHLLSKQHQAWEVAKSAWYRYELRWQDLIAKVEGTKSTDPWPAYFHDLSAEQIQETIPWPTNLTDLVPRPGATAIRDFYTRSLAALEWGTDFTTTTSIHDLEYAVDFLSSEISRRAPVLNCYVGRKSGSLTKKDESIAQALISINEVLQGMLEEYEDRLEVARSVTEADKGGSRRAKRRREDDEVEHKASKRAKSAMLAQANCEKGEVSGESWTSWCWRICF